MEKMHWSGIIPSLGRTILRFPAIALLIAPILFYLHHMEHLSWGLRLAFIGPPVLLNYLAIRLTLYLLRKRFSQKNYSLWPELILALAVTGILLLVIEIPTIKLLLPVTIIAATMIATALLHRIGVFYLFVIGIMIFCGAQLSYRLLNFEEGVYVRLQRLAVRTELAGHMPSVMAEPEKKRISLRFPDGYILRLPLPRGMYFHDAQTFTGHRRIFSGEPLIAVFSGAEKNSERTPVLFIYSVRNRKLLAVGDFRDQFERLFAYLRNIGEIVDLKDDGPLELSLSSSGSVLRGARFSMFNVLAGLTFRYDYYILRSPGGRQFLLLNVDKKRPGIDRHPDIDIILEGLQWIDSREMRKLRK